MSFVHWERGVGNEESSGLIRKEIFLVKGYEINRWFYE